MATKAKQATQRLVVKHIKTFRGHDGVGLNATLFFDGKKVCEILDDAHGGEWQLHWFGATREQRDAIQKQVEEYVATQPTKFTSVSMSAKHLFDSPSHDRTDLNCPKCGSAISVCEGFKTDDNRTVFEGDLFCRKCDLLYEFLGNTLESFVNLCVDENEINKTFKRKCKSNTLVRRKGFADSEYVVFKVPFSEIIKQRILAKFPDVIEFINERFV